MSASMAEIEAAEVFVMWSWAECSDEARRGHAYVFVEGPWVTWRSYAHGRERTPGMLARLARWEAAHPDLDPLRTRAWWPQPGGRWGFTGDLGRVLALLDGRTLIAEAGDDAAPLPALPEGFLRRPIASMVEAELGPVAWPRSFDAEQVRVGPGGLACARDGATLVVCAARYGSRFAGSGQDRTAAVFWSHDAGARWTELPWTLDPALARGVAAGFCWPPEHIQQVELVDGAPVIAWEDPWIDWEPGERWQARWRPSTGDWWMEAR